MKKKLFKPNTTGIAAIILTIASLLSYVMGMVRDIIFARYYGADIATDAYNAAFLVPDAIFNLFIAGALTAAFIPVFSGYLATEKKEDAAILARSFLLLASIVVTIVGIIAYFFMPQIIATYFSDAVAEKQQLIIDMSRILLLSPLLFAVSNTIGNILVSYKHFVTYAIAPLLYNIGIIIGIIFFSQEYGIYAAAWGAVFGILLHLVVRFYELSTINFPLKKGSYNFRHPGLKKIAWLMWPKTIGLMSWQICLWTINFIGNNTLANGSVSAFYYARNLQSLPVSIFAIALATAIFPYLSDHAAAGRTEIFTHQYEKTLRQILFLTLPAAAGIMLLAKPIVKLIYFGGSFDEQDLQVTSLVLFFFALSIPLEGAVHVTARAFYALKNTLIPVSGALILMTTLIAGSFYFAPQYGPATFAFFFTLGSLMQISLLMILLKKHLHNFQTTEFMKNTAKMSISVIIMGAVVYILNILTIHHALKIIVQISAGATAYFVTAYILKCTELMELKKIAIRIYQQKIRKQTV